MKCELANSDLIDKLLVCCRYIYVKNDLECRFYNILFEHDQFGSELAEFEPKYYSKKAWSAYFASNGTD